MTKPFKISALCCFTALGLSACLTGGTEMKSLALSDVAAKYAQSPRRNLTAAEKSAVSASIRTTLKDPDSARFNWLPLIVKKEETIRTYCGSVNARNAFGGYAGNAPYMVFIHYSKGKPMVTPINMGNGDYSGETLNVLRQCAKAGYLIDANAGSMTFYGADIPAEFRGK